MKKIMVYCFWMILFGVMTVNGKVIFYDDFSGNAATNLNGLAPGIDAIGGKTWIASSAWKADGSIAGLESCATIPFTPVSGKIYQLTARLNYPATGNWFGPGFANSSGTGTGSGYRFLVAPVIGQPWMLHRSVTGAATYQDHAYASATAAPGSADIGFWKGDVDMRIILDTRGTQWKAEWQERFTSGTDSFSTVNTFTYTTNPTIASAGLVNSLTPGVVDYWMLEEIGDGRAANPSPAYGAAGVPVTTTTLSWNAGAAANIDGYYLYVTEGEPNFVNVTPVTVTDLVNPIEAIVTLQTDKTYFWRVDERVNGSGPTDPNTVLGSVWFFASEKSVPFFTTDPAAAAAFSAETASFTAALTSLFTPTVSWYKAGSPNVLLASQTGAGSQVSGDYTVTVTALGGSSYSTKLDIANVELADQAEYYCYVSNVNGNDTSLPAGLVVKRLLARYPFDGDPNDASGTEIGTPKNAVDPNILPTYGAGIIGSGAIELNGSQYIELSTNAYPRAGLGNGLVAGTVAAWVRVDQFAAGQTTAMVLATHNLIDSTACQMWIGDANPDAAAFRIRSSTAGDTGMPMVTGNTSLVGDGQWHLLAATYEADDVAQLYIDGLAIGATDSYVLSPLTNWEFPMLIGANNNRGVPIGFLQGAMDELRIYNYRLTETQIADLYLQGNPNAKLCILNYASKYDVSGPVEDVPDCVVNLYDFAKLAKKWLDCGVYPDCL